MSTDDKPYTIKVEAPTELKGPQGKSFLDIALDGIASLLSTIGAQLRSRNTDIDPSCITKPDDPEELNFTQDSSCGNKDIVVYKDSCQRDEETNQNEG